jgi:hypothetical protein
MRPVIKTILVLAGIAVIVFGVGFAFTGLPTPAKNLPTGLGGSSAHGRNVLRSGVTWAREYTTASKPWLIRHKSSMEVAYVGEPGDTGLHRKVEVFQGVYHNVAPGQEWVFSVRLRGLIVKSYVIVGMEWFTSSGKWAGEKDIYPPVTETYQRMTVATVLPPKAQYLAVYVQLPEINPSTRIDISASSASLIRMRGSG